MTEPFQILEVATAMRSDVEQLGSKPKFWFKCEDENWLFKEARENTGEDWSEKVASEIARILDLPTHHTELAIYEGKRGCAVRSFLTEYPGVLVHGNELLGGFITGYDKEKERGQAQHTFDNIVEVIEKLFPNERERRAAAFRMVGYLVFDAVVGNTDRHHQNWGAVLTLRRDDDGASTLQTQLAPTFDHASSLGRELTDEARIRRLREGTMERYIRKGEGGIFENGAARAGMSPIALARVLAVRYPEFFGLWKSRIEALSLDAVRDVIWRLPDERISEPGREFALSFVTTSRKLLLETS